MIYIYGSFGDELKHAKIIGSKTVAVFKNHKNIGEAIIQSDGSAEINIVDEQEMSNINDILSFGVGGTVSSREGSIITGFDLNEVSIQMK
jgi:hypothetical protein